jgi:hypothetical protein
MNSRTSLPNPLFSSDGVVNVLGALKSKKRPSGSAHFPKVHGWSSENSRVKVFDEDVNKPILVLQKWFRNLIGDESTARQRIDDCAIDENIACLAAVDWNDDILDFCRMQILITERGNLMDFYRDTEEKVSAVYYRLELDPNQPGPLFTEPQPHVHVVPKGPPRFSFTSPENEFLPLAFLEFIYLHHKPIKWCSWAREVCSLKKPTLKFEGLLQVFSDGKGRLWKERRNFRSDLNELKTILGSAKRDEMRDLPKLSPDLGLLNYWPAFINQA